MDHTITVSVSQFYAIANLVIGGCFVVVIAATGYLLLSRRTLRDWWPFAVISIFFLLAGVSRFAKGLMIGTYDEPTKLGLDLISALVGIPAAIVAWPLAHRLKKNPTANDLQEMNKSLEAANIDLLHSQQLFENFMQRNPSPQFVKDAHLRFLYVNDAFCNLFNVKRDEVLGRTNQDWMPPDTARALHETDIHVLHTLQQSEQIQTIETPDGMRTFLTVKFPIWDSQFMIGAIAVDLTEQVAAEHREQQMSKIFRQMISSVREYAIFMLDPKGNILTWNEGAERLKGYSAEEAIGKNFSMFYPEEALEVNHPQQELRLALANGQYQEEGWRVRKDGSRFWANVTITPIYEDHQKLLGFTKVTRDMTDRREFESEIAMQRDKALEGSAMKSAFVANISHEIRTPLSGILGMNELLLETDLTDEQREYAQTVQESSQSLLTILNDVLDLSKVEAGRLALDMMPFNVIYTTQDATRLMSAAAKNKGLILSHQIDTSIPELVVGDPERFRQVLLNLIGNAVKFTQRGEVSVTARLISQNATTATVRFEVKDSGIGIAQEDRKYLFVPFGQVDASSTRKHGGTGLGLTISKHLVEMMHGEIDFDSEKGKGSTFWFTIPFAKSVDQSADFSARESERMPTEPTALVVEDNTILQDLAVRQLGKLGIKSVLAACGADAIDQVNGTRFDLILMDVQLPNVDGYEAARAIRRIEQGRNRHTPIIAMTANAMAGDQEKALAAGMDDYIAKPVNLDKLREICEKWLVNGGFRTRSPGVKPSENAGQ